MSAVFFSTVFCVDCFTSLKSYWTNLNPIILVDFVFLFIIDLCYVCIFEFFDQFQIINIKNNNRIMQHVRFHTVKNVLNWFLLNLLNGNWFSEIHTLNYISNEIESIFCVLSNIARSPFIIILSCCFRLPLS